MVRQAASYSPFNRDETRQHVLAIWTEESNSFRTSERSTRTLRLRSPLSPASAWTAVVYSTYQILKRRSAVINEDEKGFWNDVTADLMSDEEVPPDRRIIASRPSWRSDKLNDLIDTLNQRMLNDSNSRHNILPRKYGRASERPPNKNSSVTIV